MIYAAASDYDGKAPFYIGSVSAVASLEPAWTTEAFPECFRPADIRKISVTTVKLSTLFNRFNITDVSLLKIDAEGHEFRVLKGLFDGPVRPDVIMFEGNQRFTDRILSCLALLRHNGYEHFVMFIREGQEVLAQVSFGALLPDFWYRQGDRYLYANIIAHRMKP